MAKCWTFHFKRDWNVKYLNKNDKKVILGFEHSSTLLQLKVCNERNFQVAYKFQSLSQISRNVLKLNIDEDNIELPGLKNRTQIKSYNMLVRWKLKQKEISKEQKKYFPWFLYVFEDGNLENLCN